MSNKRIPKSFPVQPLRKGSKAQLEAWRDGRAAQCGACGRFWDDSIPTSMTPAPSARCPFEYYH